MLKIKPLLSLLALLVTLIGAGCGTLGGPASASFASVNIPNRSAEEIAAATSQVFGADGYVGGMIAPGQMIFEKEASRATAFAREGFVNASYGATTINRVRAEIVPLAGGIHRLQCKAFMITGGSDPFFQSEVPLANIRAMPYQSLLNQVAAQLK